jgi:hypothetical protein
MLRSDPKEGKFAEDLWGKGENCSYQDILKGDMDARGRGRGRGGHYEEDQWGGPPSWWNQGFPPPPFAHPQQFQPQFRFFPPQPPYPHPGQFPFGHHPAAQPHGQGESVWGTEVETSQQSGSQAQRGSPYEAGDDQAKGGDNQNTTAEKLGAETDKQSKVNYFNCAEWGHYSSECKQPRLCFICQMTEHVGRECSEWQKPITVAQYLGSAA